MTKLHHFDLPWPPSVNRMWRTVAGRMLLSDAGRSYFVRAFSALPHKRVDPHEGRLSVTIALTPPDKRPFDIDNRAKALLDACTHGKVWLDDAQVDELHIYRKAPSKVDAGARVLILELE
jgi:crossover junction endodeoxyribonuclease RusA